MYKGKPKENRNIYFFFPGDRVRSNGLGVHQK